MAATTVATSTNVDPDCFTQRPTRQGRERTLKTEWLVQEAPEGGGDELVVQLSTGHNPDRKSFSSCLTRMRREVGGPGPFTSEKFAPFSDTVHTSQERVARFSAKALQEAHDRAVAHAVAQVRLDERAAHLFRPLDTEDT